MNAPTLLAVLALVAPALGQHADRSDKQLPPPDELYANACAGCHVAPDPDRPTDRAWIDQLRDTA